MYLMCNYTSHARAVTFRTLRSGPREHTCTQYAMNLSPLIRHGPHISAGAIHVTLCYPSFGKAPLILSVNSSMYRAKKKSACGGLSVIRQTPPF